MELGALKSQQRLGCGMVSTDCMKIQSPVGLTLWFSQYHSAKKYAAVNVYLHEFLASALNESE
jgi:hypothetical protein